MEEAELSESHSHAIGVAGIDDLLVCHGPAGLSNELHTKPGRMVDRVPEGEESIRGDGDVIQAFEESALLFGRERLRGGIEVLQPLSALGLLHIAFDVAHPGIHAVLTLDAVLEGQTLHFRVEAQPPSRHLATRQLDAVDAALLACTDADHHAILAVADRVGLGILDGDGSQDEVLLGLVWDGLAGGNNLCEFRSIEDGIVALLHEAHTPDHSILEIAVLEACISLQDDELAALLRLEGLQRLRDEGRSDDTITDLDLQNHCCGHVHLVRDGNEIAKGAHRVSIPGTHVGCCNIRELLVLDLIDQPLLIAQREPDGSTSRADMLEGGGCWQTSCLAKLMNQLPGVDGVQQVDVARRAIQHLEGQLAASHGAKAGRQLMGVAAILQRHLQVKGEGLLRGRLGHLASHPCAHGRVVGRGERISGCGHVLAESKSCAASVVGDLLHEGAVLAGAGKDGHSGVVLR
mmetsp:Transcript_68402/g.160388  ORF Transcript_68402/g.160388 Transcript_68402/m.160388 type:complete len:462 (+) Transcript_68402:65-1450(+)